MHASMFVYYCGQQLGAVWGDGLIADDKFKLISASGVNHSFIVRTNNTYLIEFHSINPAIINNEIYTIFYDKRPLIQSVLNCPNTDFSGIFFIDTKRVRNADSYNTISKNIPDPTICTAYLGE